MVYPLLALYLDAHAIQHCRQITSIEGENETSETLVEVAQHQVDLSDPVDLFSPGE